MKRMIYSWIITLLMVSNSWAFGMWGSADLFGVGGIAPLPGAQNQTLFLGFEQSVGAGTFGRSTQAWSPESGALFAINAPRYLTGNKTGTQGILVEQSISNRCTVYSAPRADSLGAELVANGTMEGTYVAGVAPSWTYIRGTASADTLTPYSGVSSQSITNPAGNTGVITQSITIVSGKRYRLSFYAKAIAGNGGIVRNTASLIPTPIDITNPAWTLYTSEFTTDTTNFNLAAYANTHAVAGTNGVSYDNVSLVELVDAVGIKAYHNGTTFINPIPSMTLSGDTAAELSIVNDQTAIDAAIALNPTDGSMVALQAAKANGYKAYELTAGAGGAGNVDITGAMLAVATTMSGTFRVLSGTVTLTDSAGANSLSLSGAGYTRQIKAGFTATATRTMRITADPSSQVRFLAPQSEDLPYPTSQILTAGSTVVRGSDILTYPTSGYLSAAQGTVMAHVLVNPTMQSAATVNYVFSHGTTTANNIIRIWKNSTNAWGFQVSDAAGTTTGGIASQTLPSGWNHVAITYDSAGVKGYLNGLEVVSDTTGVTVPAALASTFSIGHRMDNTLHFDSTIDQIRVFSTVLTQPQIAVYATRGK